MSRTILKQQLRKLLDSSTTKSVDEGGKDSGRTGKKRREETNRRRKGKGRTSVHKRNGGTISKKRKIKDSKEETERIVKEVKEEEKAKSKLMEQNIRFLQNLEDDDDAGFESLKNLKKRKRRG